MPAGEIARRARSPFWWRGEHLDDYQAGQRVPSTTTMSDIPPGPLPSPDPDALAALTEALMMPRARLPWLLRCREAQVASMIAILADRLPDVLEEMPFSTYEAPGTATDFHIVGISGAQIPPNATPVPGRPSPSCPEIVRRARVLVLSEAIKERRVVSLALGAGTARDGSVSIGRIVKLIDLFDRISKGEQVAAKKLESALARSHSAIILLGMPAAVDIVVGELAAGRPEFWNPIRAISPDLRPALLAELGRSVGAAAAGPQATASLTRILALAGALPAAFTRACDDTVITRMGKAPALADQLDSAARLRLLRRAAAAHPDATAVGILLADPTDWSIPDDRGLPASWRAQVLAEHLIRAPDTAAEVATRLRAEKELMQPLAKALPVSGELLLVLSKLSLRESEQLIPDACRQLPPDRRLELVEWHTERLPPPDQPQFAARFAGPPGTWAATPRWSRFAAALAHTVVSWALRNSDPRPLRGRTMMTLLDSAEDAESRAWRSLLRHLCTGPAGSGLRLTAAWTARSMAAVDQFSEPHYGSAALDLVIFMALMMYLPDEALTRLARDVAARVPGGYEDAAVLLLTGAQRVIVPTQYEPCLVPCLRLMAWMAGTERIRTWPTGSLRNRKAQHAAESLAARLTANDVSQMSGLEQEAGTLGARWWGTASNPAGRLHRLTRLPGGIWSS
jgi:hypothetical protein